MKTLTVTEWRLIPWSMKGFCGNDCRTYIDFGDGRKEVQVVAENGKRVSHVGYPDEYFKYETAVEYYEAQE